MASPNYYCARRPLVLRHGPSDRLQGVAIVADGFSAVGCPGSQPDDLSSPGRPFVSSSFTRWPRLSILWSSPARYVVLSPLQGVFVPGNKAVGVGVLLGVPGVVSSAGELGDFASKALATSCFPSSRGEVHAGVTTPVRPFFRSVPCVRALLPLQWLKVAG